MRSVATVTGMKRYRTAGGQRCLPGLSLAGLTALKGNLLMIEGHSVVLLPKFRFYNQSCLLINRK